MNDFLRALNTDRGIQTAMELDVIKQYQGNSGRVDSDQFRAHIKEFIGRHNDQAFEDAFLDNVMSGDGMTADDDYQDAVRHLSALYRGIDDDGAYLSRGEQQTLLNQAEQVTYADIDSLVERQGGTDPELFRPTLENTGIKPEDNPNYVPVGDERQAETTTTRDPNIAAPLAEGTDVSTYTAAPGADQVAAGNALGLGHKDTGADSTLRQAQQAIFDGGHYGEGATADEVDGFFGPKTEAATRAWQEASGLEVTGRIGAEDLAELGLAPEGTERTEGTERVEGTGDDDATPGVSARRLANDIHENMRGFGDTDHERIAGQLASLTPTEMTALREAYPSVSDGVSLEDALGDDQFWATDFDRTHGINALQGLVSEDRSFPTNYSGEDAFDDARALNDAMRSDWYNPGTWGTREDALNEILTNRSPAQIRAIANEFNQGPYDGTLRDRIAGETSEDPMHQATLLAILDAAN